MKPFFHPATDRDLAIFREFEGSLEYVDKRLSDRSDVIFNWTIVGVEPCAGGKRVLLNERYTLLLLGMVLFLGLRGVHRSPCRASWHTHAHVHGRRSCGILCV